MQRRSSNILTRSRAMNVRAAAGFSLVELMVALGLSLLLLTGVVAIFTSSRVSYESTDQLSRVQETGRFALEQISRHLRSAGFPGCARQPRDVSTTLRNSGDLQWNFLEGPVRGFNATGTNWLPALSATIEQAVPTSDVLVVRGPRLDAAPMRITADMTGPTDVLTVNDASIVGTDGRVVMAYSCQGRSFFFAKQAGSTLTHTAEATVPGNMTNSTSFRFFANAEVIPVETVVYFVRESEVLPGTNSLWRRSGLATAEELVQGVDQMQVEYGVDPNDDRVVDDYVTANSVTNWDRVVAVRVALLVSSVQQYGNDTDQRTYQLLNTTVNPPGDRRLREVFTATVSIRSRLRVD